MAHARCNGFQALLANICSQVDNGESEGGFHPSTHPPLLGFPAGVPDSSLLPSALRASGLLRGHPSRLGPEPLLCLSIHTWSHASSLPAGPLVTKITALLGPERTHFWTADGKCPCPRCRMMYEAVDISLKCLDASLLPAGPLKSLCTEITAFLDPERTPLLDSQQEVSTSTMQDLACCKPIRKED